MRFDDIAEIRRSGFTGFVSIAKLQESACCEVPDTPGVYLVLRSEAVRADFLMEGAGGQFKGKNPNVKFDELERRWTHDALVLYIGKAGGNSKATLRSQLKQYMRFGQRKRVGHWGGRYIWQLRDSLNLTVCWKVTPNDVPRTIERQLIEEFERAYKKPPFANLAR